VAPRGRAREVVEDYRSRGLTLRSHPVAFLRGDLAASGYIPAAELSATRDGRRVSVAGLVLVRQRPGSANGVLFITLEDETEIANLIIWHGSGPDPRNALGRKPRDIYVPDLRIEDAINVKTRDFR
jgi:error-prone DNA polymerase